MVTLGGDHGRRTIPCPRPSRRYRTLAARRLCSGCKRDRYHGLDLRVLRPPRPMTPNIMDLRMHRIDGVEATRRLAGRPPVLALTTFSDDELLSGALRAGAAGFVLKDSSAEELIRAVRAVARGDSYLDPRRHRARPKHLPQSRTRPTQSHGERTHPSRA